MAYILDAWPPEYIVTDGQLTDIGKAYVKEHNLPTVRIIGPLPEKFLPSVIHIDMGRATRVEDIFRITNGMLVCERFRRLVEDLEPGVHQFNPVEIILSKGELFEPYYHFFPCHQIDAIFPTGTLGTLKNPGKPGAYYKGLEPGSDDIPMISGMGKDLVLSRPAIVGKHVWSPKEIAYGIFVSDEFHDRFKTAGLNNDHFTPCVEIDHPWDREEILGPVLEARRRRRLGPIPIFYIDPSEFE